MDTTPRLVRTPLGGANSLTRKARLHKIARHSSHKTSTTSSLEGKVPAINEDVPDPVNSYTSLVVLHNRSRIVLMLVGSLCVSGALGIMATMRP
ncbi:hypothetical protein K505DRAFT_157916 [Melanomma pulvis-pyrius CBS 109.77]|uniref:Uncharacterized protein n=1 Tax=Melanomma pulvis-pyrius CBS 109.77 TaxID=1314802 RepID=A0A6A6XJF0_9PLEO|nr:hypothetical protein K505DRAFT_157916 [Melanomma pulvis-pyrius CBS 109.77]